MKKAIKNNATNFDKVKVTKEKLKVIKGGRCVYGTGGNFGGELPAHP